jgi:hypothetical protein
MDSSLFEPRDLKFAIEVKTICVIPGVQARQNCAARVNVLVCTFYVAGPSTVYKCYHDIDKITK